MTTQSRILLLALIGMPRPASADDKASATLNPYLSFRGSSKSQSADVGVEYFPIEGAAPGVTASIVVAKNDPDDSFATVSNEEANIGLRLFPFTEFGPGARDTGKQSVRVSRFGVGLDSRATGALYEYNPGGGDEVGKWRFSWKSELRTWWFGSIGPSASVDGTVPEPIAGKPPMPTDCALPVVQPQLRFSYDRSWNAADEVGVVQPPDAEGLQVAETMRINGPSVAPRASVLLALAYEPGTGRFAYAPAIRFSTKGDASTWTPTGSVGRLRMELWVYYFAFEQATAVRVGLAPFVDVRTGGSDKREEVAGGAVLELRSSVARLEY